MPDDSKHSSKVKLSSGLATATGILILSFAINEVVFQATVFVAAVIAVFYCSIRLAFCFGTKAGYTIVTTISLVLAFTLFSFWRMNSKIDQLEADLDEYVSATIQRDYWPYPHVYQLSVDDYVDDKELIDMLERPELEMITHLYLYSDKLTDDCLKHVSRLEKLEHLHLDSDIFSLDAQAEFRNKNRDVTVIAPNPVQEIN